MGKWERTFHYDKIALTGGCLTGLTFAVWEFKRGYVDLASFLAFFSGLSAGLAHSAHNMEAIARMDGE